MIRTAVCCLAVGDVAENHTGQVRAAGLNQGEGAENAAAGEPTASGAGPAVKATFSVGSRTFTDVNPIARSLLQEGETVPGLRAPNADRATMHAEIGAMIQAKDAGIRGGAGLLEVEGKTICAHYCRGNVKTMARVLELDRLEVQDADGTISLFPTPQSLQPIKHGGQGWIASSLEEGSLEDTWNSKPMPGAGERGGCRFGSRRSVAGDQRGRSGVETGPEPSDDPSR